MRAREGWRGAAPPGGSQPSQAGQQRALSPGAAAAAGQAGAPRHSHAPTQGPARLSGVTMNPEATVKIRMARFWKAAATVMVCVGGGQGLGCRSGGLAAPSRWAWAVRPLLGAAGGSLLRTAARCPCRRANLAAGTCTDPLAFVNMAMTKNRVSPNTPATIMKPQKMNSRAEVANPTCERRGRTRKVLSRAPSSLRVPQVWRRRPSRAETPSCLAIPGAVLWQSCSCREAFLQVSPLQRGCPSGGVCGPFLLPHHEVDHQRPDAGLGEDERHLHQDLRQRKAEGRVEACAHQDTLVTCSMVPDQAKLC